MKYQHKQLANKLNVLTLQIPDGESVVFSVFIKAGSRYEQKEEAGIAHFLEHVFFKGSRNYPTSNDISTAIDAIGGDMNAATSKESTEFYIKASKDHFGLIFDVLTDMIINPLFLEEEIEKEKGVVIEEINGYQDSPGAQVEVKLEEAMWPKSPLGRDIIGSKESISKLTKEKIFKFKETYYQPENIILGISGKFDYEAAMKKINKTWAKLPTKEVPSFKKANLNQSKPNIVVEHKKTQQTQLALGFKSFEHGNKDNLAVYLLASILGGSMSSRLFMTIREQKGLAYYVRASNTPYFNTGNFTIHAGLKISKTKEALVQILSEIRKVKTDLITDMELKRAKQYIKGKIALSLEDNHEKLDWILERYAFTGNIKMPEEFFRELDKVTAEDLKRVADKIFTNERMSLAIVGPFKGSGEFEKEFHLKRNH